MDQIICFPNGNILALHNGQQQPCLQKPWLLLLAEWLGSQGQDPASFRLILPNGQIAHFFQTSEGGWNWQIKEDGRSPDIDPKLEMMPIDDLNLSVRAYNCLKDAGIQTVGELIGRTGDELLRVKNLGKVSLAEIEKELQGRGLRLKW